MKDKKKKVYEEMKQELKRYCGDTRYFNMAFFEKYLSAQKKTLLNMKNGIDDHYEKNGIIFWHSYDEIYDSVFYQKNSSTYCAFLEIASWNRNKVLSVI